MRTIHSDKGYSMLEVLISTALGTLVLAGVFDVYVASTKNLTGQANVVHMQADTKAAMDFMVRELRAGAATYAALDTSQPNTIKFARVEDYGYASGGTATTLTDSTKAWATNPQKFAGGTYFVWIKAGTGATSPPSSIAYPILSNTTNTLTLAGTGWPLPYPTTDSLYFIVRKKAFTLYTDPNDGTKTARFSNNNGGTYSLLAQNVTALSFSQGPPSCPAAGTVCVTLAARSKDKDPNTGEYRTYTLTDTANPRN